MTRSAYAPFDISSRWKKVSILFSDDEESRPNIAEPSLEEKRLTRISIAIVIIYILCHIWKLPLSISEAWNSIAKGTTSVQWEDSNWYNIVHDISHGLILANSAFNFIFYLVL